MPQAVAVIANTPAEGWNGAASAWLATEIGDWQIIRGDRAGALTYFEKSLAIFEKLAAADPDRPEWQLDLAMTVNRVAETMVAVGDIGGARQHYERSHRIRAELAKIDPSSPDWQHRVAFSVGRLADVALAGGDTAGALDKYQVACAAYKKLATADETLPEWQLRLVHHTVELKRAELIAAAGAPVEMLRVYRDYLALDRMASPDNLQERASLTTRNFACASQTEAQRAALTNALAVMRRLDTTGQLDVNDKGWITLIEAALAAAQAPTKAKRGFLGRLLGRKS